MFERRAILKCEPHLAVNLVAGGGIEPQSLFIAETASSKRVEDGVTPFGATSAQYGSAQYGASY
jgi:hypothetical protein